MLKGAGEVALNIQKAYQDSSNGKYIIGKNTNSVHVTNTATITAGVVLTDYKDFWHSIKVTIMESDGRLYYKTLDQLTKNATNAKTTMAGCQSRPRE